MLPYALQNNSTYGKTINASNRRANTTMSQTRGGQRDRGTSTVTGGGAKDEGY